MTRLISFRRLYERGGRLTLQGSMGLFKIDRLFPDYVTQQSAGKDTVHSRSPKRDTGWSGNYSRGSVDINKNLIEPDWLPSQRFLVSLNNNF